MSARSCRLRKYGKPGTTLYVLQGTTIRHVPNPGYDERTRHLLRSDESRGVRRYVPPWWVCPVLWRKAVVAWDASAPLHDHAGKTRCRRQAPTERRCGAAFCSGRTTRISSHERSLCFCFGLVLFPNFFNPMNSTTFVLFDKYCLIVD